MKLVKLILSTRPAGLQDWLLVAFIVLVWGLKGILIFWLLMYLLTIFTIVFMDEARSHLLESGGLNTDDKEIKFLCRLGLHFWGPVIVEEPVTETAKLWQKTYRFRYGKRTSLCCTKDQLVRSLISINPNEKNYWFNEDKSSGLYQDFKDNNQVRENQ
ncbi:MAG: hypothetical protein HZB99_00405 [Candidatus Harrisonbacteria bacterium]|nr:hypothetical protein [Candidatus Harrisonbacteria bacterium]